MRLHYMHKYVSYCDIVEAVWRVAYAHSAYKRLARLPPCFLARSLAASLSICRLFACSLMLRLALSQHISLSFGFSSSSASLHLLATLCHSVPLPSSLLAIPSPLSHFADHCCPFDFNVCTQFVSTQRSTIFE